MPTADESDPWPVTAELIRSWLAADPRPRRHRYETVRPERPSSAGLGSRGGTLGTLMPGLLVALAMFASILGQWTVIFHTVIALVLAVEVYVACLVCWHVLGRWLPHATAETTAEGCVRLKVDGHAVRWKGPLRAQKARWSDLIDVQTDDRTLVLTYQDGRRMEIAPPWQGPSPTLDLVAGIAVRVVAARRAYLARDQALQARMERGLSAPEEQVLADRGLSAADD